MKLVSEAHAYQRARDSILKDVLAWRRSNDQAKMANARSNLAELFRLSLESQDAKRVEVVVSGWVMPSFRRRLSKARLQVGNPGYDVAITRHSRVDVANAYGWSSSQVGFQVRVSRNQNAARGPFVIGVMRGDGRLMGIPVSNPEARASLNDSGRAEVQVAVAGRKSKVEVGFIDAVVEAPRVDPRETRTWFAGFVHEYPGIAFDLLDHESFPSEGAATAADVFREFDEPVWAARFDLLAKSAHATPLESHLVVQVTRPDRAPLPGDTVPVPDLRVIRNGAVAVRSSAAFPRVRQEWLDLDNVEIQAGGTVLQDRRLIAYEAGADPSLHFVAGLWDTVLGSASRPEQALVRLLPLADSSIQEGILLSGRNDDNWYHWMMEYAPRALQVPEDIAPDVPFLVSSRTPKAGRDALAELSERPVHLVDATSRQRVSRLHVVAPPVQILDTTRIPWSEGLSINPETLIAARELWRDTGPARFPGRVILRRRSSRRGLINEPELVAVAEKKGFTAIDPVDLDWPGQRNLFSHADVVLGASGAVMANYLLMKPGSHVVAMTSRQLADFVLPAALASLADVHFRYVLGDSPSRPNSLPDRNFWLHSDFVVHRRALRRALRDLA